MAVCNEVIRKLNLKCNDLEKGQESLKEEIVQLKEANNLVAMQTTIKQQSQSKVHQGSGIFTETTRPFNRHSTAPSANSGQQGHQPANRTQGSMLPLQRASAKEISSMIYELGRRGPI